MKTGEIAPYLTYKDVDFSRTEVLAGNFGGGIYLNIKGKHSLGTIEQENYEKAILGIMKDLKELKNPKTGEKLFERVYRREDLYKGPYIEDAPDLIVESEGNGYDTVGWLGYNYLINKEPVKSGNHRRNGIVFLYGKGIKSKIIKNAKIIDIAPTVLKLIGIKVEGLDGRSLLEE
jgi:predicted AlkP superfamily phosphohydrolase/phosphomutase